MNSFEVDKCQIHSNIKTFDKRFWLIILYFIIIYTQYLLNDKETKNQEKTHSRIHIPRSC